MEEILARHRREQKDLQGRITSKKKNATKKSRKGVNDECDALERDLKERQQDELRVLTPSSVEDETAKLNPHEQPETSENPPPHGESTKSIHQRSGAYADPAESTVSPQINSKKPNRQKARLARRAAEQEAEIEAAAEEAANMPDQREQELSAMKVQMQKRGLNETMIRPDGHCLYSACAQTITDVKTSDYKRVRVAAADYMSAHANDFTPFMEEPIQSYTRKIKDTAEWGGHLELQAIAKAFDVNINVLRADGHVEKIGPETDTKSCIWLAYYKHSFGLGEHYNALSPTPTA